MVNSSDPPLPEQETGRKRLGLQALLSSRVGIWVVLLLLSAAVTAGLREFRIPASLMLGPMIAAILLVQIDGKVRVGRPLLMAAQALLGCRLGMAVSPDLLRDSLGYLPVLFGFTLAIVFISAVLAVGVSRIGWFPESSAVWGLSSGAASAMVILAEMHGSDARIVALMQYLRVVTVALAAITIGTLLGTPEAHHLGVPTTGAGMIWFPPIRGIAFAETLALAATGPLVARLSGQPMAVLFVPMIGGAILQITGLVVLDMPAFLMAAAFAVIGWNIGLKFTRASLGASVRLMPRIAAVIAAMIAICGLLSILLAGMVGSDALSAYLALSPGGLDSVFIIATSTHVDLSLVLAAQVVRLIVVMSVAPPLARYVVRRGFYERKPAE